MTENQEKELFTTLASLDSGVNQIQFDVKDIKSTLAQHSKTLTEHSGKLDHLVAKTDTIADQVIKNDLRLSARLTSVEQAVDEMGGKTH
jgi:ABC-type transporter Mla subunit MlaD